MKIFQVDAFTDHVFGGNPAAVIPLESWCAEEKMQQIAMENNLSETAFFVKEGNQFHIKWFTPEMEIDLCGHATLASGHVIFNHLGYREDTIRFHYGGGSLSITKNNALLSMDFPSVNAEKTDISNLLSESLGGNPVELYQSRDLMVVYNSEEEIISREPDFIKMSEVDTLGVIITAPGKNVDFVSRFFAPRAGINEDPVTGSAHCMLIPYWAKRLKKNRLNALQLSKRIGKLSCEYKGERVEISGNAITYMIGEVYI